MSPTSGARASSWHSPTSPSPECGTGKDAAPPGTAQQWVRVSGGRGGGAVATGERRVAPTPQAAAAAKTARIAQCKQCRQSANQPPDSQCCGRPLPSLALGPMLMINCTGLFLGSKVARAPNRWRHPWGFNLGAPRPRCQVPAWGAPGEGTGPRPSEERISRERAWGAPSEEMGRRRLVGGEPEANPDAAARGPVFDRFRLACSYFKKFGLG